MTRRLVSLLAFGLALHLHRFHGSSLDYVTLAAGAFASWVGVPGPGEPLLIAAGVLAARHKLDLAELLLIAFAGATLGGIGGWLIGMKAGRAILERPGPLLRARRRALARGEEVFARWPALAVLMTMSWISGINRVRPGVYMLWNAVGAGLWTLSIGLGAFFVGPPVVDLVNDAGWITVVGVCGVVGAALVLEFGWRRRRGRAVRQES